LQIMHWIGIFVRAIIEREHSEIIQDYQIA